MKRHYIILSTLLTLFIVVIIISISITKWSLKEIVQEEEKMQVQEDVSSQISISPITIEHKEESSAVAQIKKTEEPKELEFDLNQIPEEYFNKDIEGEEGEQIEKLLPGEKKLNKEPSLQKLKELKTKRVIIY